MPTQLKTRTVENDGGTFLVVTVSRKASIDVQSSIRVEDELRSLDPTARVVLDLGEVEAIRSSLISAVIRVSRAMSQGGGRLCLCNVGPQVLSVLQALKLDRLVVMRDSVDEALAAIAD